MPTFIVLYRFTDQGRKRVKDTVRRAARVRAQNEKLGFKVIGSWWTQGQYDLVSVVEAPSEEAMVGGLFNVAETGNVASETLHAFTEDEMKKILKGPRKAPARRASRAKRPARRS